MNLVDILQKNLKLILFFCSFIIVISTTYFFISDEKNVQSILYKLNYNQLSKHKKEINRELIKSFNAYDKYDSIILSAVSIDKLKVEYKFSTSKMLFDEKKIQTIIEKSFDDAVESLNFVLWNYADNMQKKQKNVELLENNLRVESRLKNIIVINLIGIFVIFGYFYIRWVFTEPD